MAETYAFLVIFTSLITMAGMALALYLLAGKDSGRLVQAGRFFFLVLRDASFRDKAAALLLPPPPPPPPKLPKPSGVPLRMLNLLQREGRLVDFLLEDIQSYPDMQVGAAVRDIHRKCRAALQEHVVLEPVLTQPEGSQVNVQRGFDPSAIRVVGNVTGEPPYHGTLQHHGWRVKEIKLPAPAEGMDELILQPAEVELQ